ncbi:hypothetical protein CGLAMM_01640 [Acetobacteraceae bacterium EV16G]|uniref:Uncharacterized protein n=1 Tax=Sorlinia euscelidii TaxID=3081148 RepID=A0ABU7U1I8_9PROT
MSQGGLDGVNDHHGAFPDLGVGMAGKGVSCEDRRRERIFNVVPRVIIAHFCLLSPAGHVHLD